MSKVNVLGVQVDCLDVSGLLDQVADWITAGEKRTILYVNAYCLNTACNDPGYHSLLNAADLVYSDGISVVWASRFLGGCELTKMTGADWIEDFCRRAVAGGWRISILGGKPEIAKRAGQNLMRRYPGLHIVSTGDGYFRQKSEAQTLAEIQAAGPDVLFAGLGTPRQERWLAEHRQDLPAPVCWAVGALFDYVAGAEKRAPGWMKALALEWLWRLLIDPRRKWRRYLLGNPTFVMRIAQQKIQRRS